MLGAPQEAGCGPHPWNVGGAIGKILSFQESGWWGVIDACQEEGKGNMEASPAQTLRKHRGYRARQGCLRIFQNTFTLPMLGGVEL